MSLAIVQNGAKRKSRVRRKFPDTPPNSPWPGAWHFGVDFAEGYERVIAIRVGDGDIKYGLNWIGPLVLTEENMKRLSVWAEDVLGMSGGYVHLLPADGDATAELKKMTSRL